MKNKSSFEMLITLSIFGIQNISMSELSIITSMLDKHTRDRIAIVLNDPKLR